VPRPTASAVGDCRPSTGTELSASPSRIERLCQLPS
jgi:hypothetical protein